jgi:hypothetical protein
MQELLREALGQALVLGHAEGALQLELQQPRVAQILGEGLNYWLESREYCTCRTVHDEQQLPLSPCQGVTGPRGARRSRCVAMPSFTVGQKVEARYRGGKKWFAGSVRKGGCVPRAESSARYRHATKLHPAPPCIRPTLGRDGRRGAECCIGERAGTIRQ